MLYITGGDHPERDTLKTFRQRFLPEFGALFVQVLTIAHELRVLRLEAQLKAEVQRLLERAAAVNAPGPVDLDWPTEVKRRGDRLQKIAEVNAEIEQRAQERYRREQAAYEAKQAERAAREQARGLKLGGKKPQAPVPGPRPGDQVNFTDGDSRILPVAGGGLNQPTTLRRP